MRNGKLSEEAKTFVVQALACFDPLGVIVKTLQADFDVSITPQSVEAYDPNKRAGRNLANKWRMLFEETRKAFLENTAEIGIANRAVRLRALNRMADKAETMGNMALAAQLHEQAAKEVGESYTNRRELTGKDGGAIQVERPSAAEIAQDIESKLAGLAARGSKKSVSEKPDT